MKLQSRFSSCVVTAAGLVVRSMDLYLRYAPIIVLSTMRLVSYVAQYPHFVLRWPRVYLLSQSVRPFDKSTIMQIEYCRPGEIFQVALTALILTVL